METSVRITPMTRLGRTMVAKSRRSIGVLFAAMLFAAAASIVPSAQQRAAQQGTHYVRFSRGSVTSFGIRDGETVREFKGDIFQNPTPTGKTYKLSEVKLLVPLDWEKVHKIIGV